MFSAGIVELPAEPAYGKVPGASVRLVEIPDEKGRFWGWVMR